MAEAKTKKYEVVRAFGLGKIAGQVGDVVALSDDDVKAIGGVATKTKNGYEGGFVIPATAKKGKDDEE